MLLKSDAHLVATDWSRDGRLILYQRGPLSNRDLYVLPVTEKSEPLPVQTTPFDEIHGQFSPNGRWVAFVTNESGRYQVYVRSFPGNDRKIQISTEGGMQPRWRRDGGELYFLGGDTALMAVPMRSVETLDPGVPVRLFETAIPGDPVFAGISRYAVTPEPTRFLFLLQDTQTAVNPIIVVQNWLAAVTR